MIYIGIDGNVHSDELKHWKYIKKIKTSDGYRYFYNEAEIDAYYKEKMPPSTKDYWKKLDGFDAREKALEKQPKRDLKYYQDKRKVMLDRQKAWHDYRDKAYNKKSTMREKEETIRAYRFAQKHPALHEIRVTTDLTAQKSKNKIAKGKTKAEKLIKSETAGTKRAINAVKGEGNNFYSPKDTKTYSKYDPKKKRFGKKKYKTGRIERRIINAYRKTHPYE